MKLLSCFIALLVTGVGMYSLESACADDSMDSPLVAIPVAGTVNFSGEAQTNETISLGALPQNKKHVFVVRLVNEADAELVLTETKSSCGCLVGVPKSRKIEKGCTSSLLLTFLPSSKGSVRKEFTVSGTAGGANIQIHIKIDAMSLPIFELAPSEIEISQAAVASVKITENFRAPTGKVVDFRFSGKEVASINRVDDTLMLKLNPIEWRAGEFSRQRTILAMIEERVVQEMPLSLLNPDGMLVRPTIGLARIGESTDYECRFFLSANAPLIDTLDQGDFSVRLGISGVLDGSEARIISKKRVSSRTFMIVIAVQPKALSTERTLEFCLQPQGRKLAEVRLIPPH